MVMQQKMGGWGMSSEWPEVSVGQVSTLVTKGTTPTTVGHAFQEDGVRFVKVETLSEDGRFLNNKFAHISEAAHQALLRSQLQIDDVLFTIAGTIGRTGIVKADHLPANTNQAVAIVRPDRAKVEPRFLRYVLGNRAFTRNAQSKTVQSVQANFSLGELRQAKFPLPSLKTQREVLAVLAPIDDRITLLRETNATLEAIAQALFKSWFVDFDPVRAKMEGRAPEGMDEATAALFPDSFEESELGLVPRGWKTARVADIAEVVKGKSYSSKNLVESHHTALVTLKSFERGGGFRMDGFKPYSGAYKPAQIVMAGDLILAYTDVTQAAELIGKPAIVVGVDEFQTLVASLDVGIIRPNEVVCGKQFLYGLFRTDAFQAHTLAHTSGTTVLHLAKDGVGSYVFPLPNVQLVHSFEEIASAIGERKQTNSDAIRTLTTLRDTLLPRLISGTLRLPEAHAELEAV